MDEAEKWLAEGEDWGSFVTGEGGTVLMRRLRRRVRFYTPEGAQVGPEHADENRALAYATAEGWKDPAKTNEYVLRAG